MSLTTPEPPIDLAYLAREVHRLAHNIWWTWNPSAQELFALLAPRTWVNSGHNAVAVVNAMSQAELLATLASPQVQPLAKRVIEKFEGYLGDKHTWASFHAPEMLNKPVAYFSAEFGLHESLPIYSGGLGILSGDHAKSASDLGIPFVAIGLFYRNGYFSQQIDPNGWQQELYPAMDPANLPLERVNDKTGDPVKCRLSIGHSEVTVGAWRVNVGRNPLYLLDTNFSENEDHWRDITSRVYGGDASMRIAQEIVLGIGGARFLEALGMEPAVYHLNEGHPAFAILELLRRNLEAGLSLEDSQKKVREKVIFTTHTPVPAGHDRFTRDLVEYMLAKWPEKLRMTGDQFMGLGRENPGDAGEAFCMTVLALRHCRAANAVSELNGEVSRKMWTGLYEREGDTIPRIGHITNGVHMLGWTNRITYEFWEQTLGPDWLKHMKQSDFWEKVSDESFLPDAAIWGLRYRLKRQMIEAMRERMGRWQRRQGPDYGHTIENHLSPDAMTLGFSRRFATYKRATLLFRDLDRLARILGDPKRPVQLVFAGKAHPRDDAAKGLIQNIFHISRDRRFMGKIFVIEDYDIQLARFIVSGVDALLNTPRRPLEACGTSGMKLAIHGSLQIGILDGWWREGYDGHNGFAIGKDESSPDAGLQDEIDAKALYDALEYEAIPEYFDRDKDGRPHKWLHRVRRAMATLIPKYTTDRMVAEYTEKYYKTRG